MNGQLLAFIWVSLLIALVPGLDTALITRNVVTRGRRAGMLTALGTSSGLCIHAVAVALGVSALLLRSATAFEAIKLCGALYLGLLGLLAICGSFRDHPYESASCDEVPVEVRTPRFSHPYVQGLITNVTNPKAFVFFLTFLPQFLGSGHGVVLKALALAMVPVALNLAWLGIYAVLIGHIVGLLRRPAVRRWQDRILGIAFIGFGVRLATERV